MKKTPHIRPGKPLTSIALYRPRRGKAAALRKVVSNHVATLRKCGLVTATKPILLQAEDGTLLEIFEWKSPESIEKAHEDPRVLKMWQVFNKACTYVSLSDLKESKGVFPGFLRLK